MNEAALTRDHVETAVLNIARVYPQHRALILGTLQRSDFHEGLRRSCFEAMRRLHVSHRPFHFSDLERELANLGVSGYRTDTFFCGLISVAAKPEDLPEYLAWLQEKRQNAAHQ